MPVIIDTVITYRDSLYLDTVFDTLTDTLVFTKDSITVIVIRDTITKRTHVNITSPPVEREVIVKVPVTTRMVATWGNVWRMVGDLAWRWSSVFPLLLIAVLLFLLLKLFNIRR